MNNSKVNGYTIEKCIGKGSYGSVYSCRDYRGERYAVKAIPVGDNGIPSLMEASIMTSYSHPYIISAKEIISNPKEFYIFMELAETDMLRYIHKNVVSLEMLKRITHQCLLAVTSLHQQGIIHCDIKPNNILLFPNGDIKIADFSLSTLKISQNESFEFKICATNYRPPEVLKNEKWNQAVDIWALGCTFYELATGSILVPQQYSEMRSANIDRQHLYKMTLCVIHEWRKLVGDSTTNIDTFNISAPKKITIPNTWSRVTSEFNNMVNCMLTYDHRRRPDCMMLLRHPYYDGCKTIQYTINSPNPPTITESISKSIDYYFSKIPHADDAMISLTKEIYFRASDIPDNVLKKDTCAWIASKILTGRSMDQKYMFSQFPHVKDCERKICISLGFRLHVILPDQLTYNIKPYREFP